MTVASPSVVVKGITRGALPWWYLHWTSGEKSILVLPDGEDPLDLVDDLKALFKIPADWASIKTFDARAYPEDDEAMRQVSLYEWTFGHASLLVTSLKGLDWACNDAKSLETRFIKMKPGSIFSRTEFEERLSNAGFVRNERSEQVGEYAIRGDVIDIWPPAELMPIRITWNLDTVEAIREIDIHTQRSENYRTSLVLHPMTAGEGATLATYVGDSTPLIFYKEDGGWIDKQISKKSILVVPDRDETTTEAYESPPAFAGHAAGLRDQLMKWHNEDWRVLIFCHNRGERDRLEELLKDVISAAKGTRPPWLPPMIIGELEHGFLQPLGHLAILANSEIFGRYRKRVRLPKFEGGGSLASVLDIHPNDYLVHEKHGIGRYLGLKNLKVGKVASEYLSIEYKGGDKLYVPIFEIQQVQKYMGAEGRRPPLSSLDTAAWERVKSKVQEDVAQLAADLLRQAAKRNIRPGHAFPPRTKLEEEFSSSFIYKLTPDQEKTIDEVEGDMMSPRAMDRLVCGDVGYGKTEVAMRAALKCALSGKQVALLCPTTILAEQHARNFLDRFADYPVTINFISRFQDKSEQKKIIEAVAKGSLDIVIGTHRLLSADVHYKDLGLLIIDEEHRFGVRQKNKVLNYRETVDVLSLTATPIPRTLASSLAGIKDLSVIETPPEGRLPISTHVGLFNEDLMVKAVQQELDRGGQVFYVHNRVKTLFARKEWLKSLLPNIRIAMAHGQMNETELETAMYDFLHNKVDVLLATTIIESGLDIPSVNTLIVEEAEEMGLSQLYQLRGRVGRSRAKAYCYLFYSGAGLTTDAKKRLEALKEFTSLGSGIRLAMRDMEIRGAGNLLGPQQHGDMAAVGIETYSKLLNEEIQRLKGEEILDQNSNGPLFEISLNAFIPDDYLPSEFERVQMYKRVLSANKEDLAKIKEELIDRCGVLPEPTKVLFDAASLRLIAKDRGISEVHQEVEGILIYFRPKYQVPEASFKKLLEAANQGMELIQGPPTGVRVDYEANEAPLDTLGRFIRSI